MKDETQRCKYHCRCMNLDGQCPHPHYLDSKCICPRPEQDETHTYKEGRLIESIEFKKLIPENIDIIFDLKNNPLCSRQAISNLIRKEVEYALTQQQEKFKEIVDKVLKPLEKEKYLFEIEGVNTAWIHLGFLNKIKNYFLSELNNQ